MSEEQVIPELQPTDEPIASPKAASISVEPEGEQLANVDTSVVKDEAAIPVEAEQLLEDNIVKEEGILPEVQQLPDDNVPEEEGKETATTTEVLEDDFSKTEDEAVTSAEIEKAQDDTVEYEESKQDDLSEPYSDFIIQDPEPMPDGDFFEDVCPVKREQCAGVESETDKSTEHTETTTELEQKEQVEEKKTLDEKEKRKSRASQITLDAIFKTSVSYAMKPRLDVDLEKLSGDFTENLNTEARTRWATLLEYSVLEESSEDEESLRLRKDSSKSDDSTERISRYEYYERHAELKREIHFQTLVNNLLNRKVAVYYKRKNMEDVWKESGRGFQNKYKYYKHLDDYEELMKRDKFKRTTNDKYIDSLKEVIDKKSVFLKDLFADLQKRETEVGTGLIYTKTGVEISERLIQHLVNRQKHATNQLISMRLVFLQLKRLVAEKEAAIQSINNVDESHHLSYYEKMKEENKIYCDKLEEREFELTNLRFKFNNTVQVLAHLREKIAAFDSDILDSKEDRNDTSGLLERVRAKVMEVKKQRDNYRTMYTNLQQTSGLLKEKTLLRDMEHCMDVVHDLKAELEYLVKACGENSQKIRRIRKLIEEQMEPPKKKAAKAIESKKNKLRQLPVKHVRTKPVQFIPVLPKDALSRESLRFLAPTVTRININKSNVD